MYKTRLLSWIDCSTLIVGMFLCIKLGSCHGLAVLHLLQECFYVCNQAPVMDWQFYAYCRNVSMYKTSLLSQIDSSSRIVGMFLCIKLGSCHGLAVCYLLYIIIIIVIVIIIILCIRQPDPKYHVKYCYHFSSIVPIVVVCQKLLHFNLLL